MTVSFTDNQIALANDILVMMMMMRTMVTVEENICEEVAKHVKRFYTIVHISFITRCVLLP
jgi:hypothetical protein